MSWDWRFKILRAQIKQVKPDVLFIQEQSIVTDDFMKELKSYVRMIICQIASPLPPRKSFRHSDLVFSSFPHFVERFRRDGIQAELVGLGFDPRPRDLVAAEKRDIPLTFIGGISRAHSCRRRVLEKVAEHFLLKWYGYGYESLSHRSPLRNAYCGSVVGLAMYRVLARSQVTINCHIDEARDFANNMRLFEATGMKTCLVTDWKKNIHDFFESDQEVMTYASGNEILEKIQYLLDHENERLDIARRGQARTLRDHTYERRMPKLLNIIRRRL
jgi:spore maturation protein CgeB